MTITLLNLYNAAATQEWSMYDNNLTADDELEATLVLALNKAIMEVLYSYPFDFRERVYMIITSPPKNGYDLPKGLIKKDNYGHVHIRMGEQPLTEIQPKYEVKFGMTDSFFVQNNKIYFYPLCQEKRIITMDYYTLIIGEDKDGEGIYSLKNKDDILYCPGYLEEIMKNAIIAKAMLNSIASESDENYSAYKKQADKAYKLLMKYAKGGWSRKEINI